MIRQLISKKEKSETYFSKNMPDFILIITVLLLLGIGLVMVLSSSEPSALNIYSDPIYYFKKQVVFAIIGICACMLISKLNYKVYKKYIWLSYFISLGLLIAVVFVGKGAKGAVRWINIGPIQFQPSELAKILLINFNASYITSNIRNIKNSNKFTIIVHLLSLICALYLLYIQPHFSAIIIISMYSFCMLLTSGYNLFHTFIVILISSLILTLIFFAKDYRRQRFFSFLHPFENTSDSTYQVTQSLYAIGSGGAFGVGLGKSRQKYSYLPEPYNDFIFSIIGEELGFVGCIVIIFGYCIFIFRGYLIAARCKDLYGSLLAIGITTMFAVQVILNICVTIALCPVTGISLPFMSYGGTALLIQLMAVGILLNISRENSKNSIENTQEKFNSDQYNSKQKEYIIN